MGVFSLDKGKVLLEGGVMAQDFVSEMFRNSVPLNVKIARQDIHRLRSSNLISIPTYKFRLDKD